MLSLRRARRALSRLATKGATTAIFLVLLILGAGALAWWHLDANAEDQARATEARGAAMVAQSAARAIEEIDQTLQTVIGGRRAPQSADLTQQERYTLLAERAPHDRYIGFIDVIAADGGILASTRPGQELKNWADRDYFWISRNEPLSGPYIGRPFAVTREDTAAIPISHRIDREGQFAGVAVAALRLSYFHDLLGELQSGPGASVTLLSEDGTILMRLPFDLNDIGRKTQAEAAVHDFIQSKAAAATLRLPGERGSQDVAFHRVGNLPLLVRVSVAPDKSGMFWLICVGAAVALAAGVLARRVRQDVAARNNAEHESQEKSRFLTNLSHELRTPLQAVLGYADRLSHDATLTADQAHEVNEILGAAKQMRIAVNAVLDYARIEAIGPALHPQWVELRPLIEDCVAMIEPGARARGLQTRTTFDQGVPTHFVTDENHLRQILGNLLNNAVKYTPTGTVECRVHGNAERLTIEVADTGIGIPEMLRHRLFREFERFGAERTGIEGTGLGLSIAQRLAWRMGGQMGHRDNTGGGSVFWLELPAATPERREARVEPARADTCRSLNILVVDDSDINRELIGCFLRGVGHRVSEARDGVAAVRIAAANDFDLVLMDMRMAGLDGLEATRRIRALQGSRGLVPIVAVTANALDQHADACRRAGMSDHLAKPFTQEELLAVVARAARCPIPQSPAAPAIDQSIIDLLVASLGESRVERLLDQLALRIESLLRRMDDPIAIAPEEAAELAHELIGGAGTLGFRRLAEAASRYESALAGGDADATEIRCAALAALTELRRRRSLEALITC